MHAAVGAKSVGLMKIIMFLLWPLAKPISILLDWVLGGEVGTIHSKKQVRCRSRVLRPRSSHSHLPHALLWHAALCHCVALCCTAACQQLMQLLKIHMEHKALDADELGVMTGAMAFKQKEVRDVMTKVEDVYMLQIDQRLNFATMADLFRRGHSRVPVYQRDTNDVVGVLYTKDLILIDPEVRIRAVHRRRPPRLPSRLLPACVGRDACAQRAAVLPAQLRARVPRRQAGRRAAFVPAGQGSSRYRA